MGRIRSQLFDDHANSVVYKNKNRLKSTTVQVIHSRNGAQPIFLWKNAFFQEPVLFARSIRENILLGLANPKMVAGEVIPSAGYLAQKMHLT